MKATVVTDSIEAVRPTCGTTETYSAQARGQGGNRDRPAEAARTQGLAPLSGWATGYDPWCDTDDTPFPLRCRVQQIAVTKGHGALRSRLHHHGHRDRRGNRLLVLFDGEDNRSPSGRVVQLRPELSACRLGNNHRTLGRPHGVALLQELLPGSKIDHVTSGLLDHALALNDLQAGVLAQRSRVRPIDLHLLEDGPGFCLHGPLREHSRRSARLDRWIREVGGEHPLALLGDDAVHFDFDLGNLLADADRVTGVIDWDGTGRDDRRFDLVTLRFGLRPKSVAPGVVGHLEEILDAMAPESLRPAWAHMSLRMTDWAIRHFTPGEVASGCTSTRTMSGFSPIAVSNRAV